MTPRKSGRLARTSRLCLAELTHSAQFGYNRWACEVGLRPFTKVDTATRTISAQRELGTSGEPRSVSAHNDGWPQPGGHVRCPPGAGHRFGGAVVTRPSAALVTNSGGKLTYLPSTTELGRGHRQLAATPRATQKPRAKGDGIERDFHPRGGGSMACRRVFAGSNKAAWGARRGLGF